MSDGPGRLKISELAEEAGVPVATVRHYLREGLLPEGEKTSRNMAYYPGEFVDRIRLIKQLQEERYMPLRVIKDLLDEDPERAQNLIELGDRLRIGGLQGGEEAFDLGVGHGAGTDDRALRGGSCLRILAQPSGVPSPLRRRRACVAAPRGR